MIRMSYEIKGVVQGVGFRPFIYKIAHKSNLCGFVYNNNEGVYVEVEGSCSDVEKFETFLAEQLPPLAKIDSIKKHSKTPLLEKSFIILQTPSDTLSQKTALVSADIATCTECLEDVKKQGKYHNYFATNCTNCGPRYTIIETLPYDRANTSMKTFQMCDSCLQEYNDPNNRRYHAQPVACNECGPKLSCSIEEAAKALEDGKIIAIKGIGGFHIMCDARDEKVVNSLRAFKNRPAKPFALMCKNITQVEELAYVDQYEQKLLTSKEAPIVILKSKNSKKIASSVAPNIEKIGCFLPYTVLHHLLFEYIDFALIATSANLGGDPIITEAIEIEKKLPFIELILDYDREIINGIDDSVVQVVCAKRQTLRLSRGYAPKVIKLPFKIEKNILAVGANQKSAIAFAFDESIILSPHIGDLDSIESCEFFQRTLQTFKRFYDFEEDLIVHDLHPSYESSKWAKSQNKELLGMQHHLAHIYATKAEFALSGEYLGFSFDGTGYGEDGTLWGGEVFVGDTRKYSFKPLKLLGGEKAIKEPRRVALSLLFGKYTLEEVLTFEYAFLKTFQPSEIKMLHQSYMKNLNAPVSSSVGRLFDAVASFGDILHFQTYEGEAGMLCEYSYDNTLKKAFSYTIEDGLIDIAFDFGNKDIVTFFINTLVNIVVDIAYQEKLDVILSGGVFQNKVLLELLLKRFNENGVTYYFQQESAINDGGIALGQIYYAVENLHKKS